MNELSICFDNVPTQDTPIAIIGNCQMASSKEAALENGRYIIGKIATRMYTARTKHPDFNGASNVISEIGEFLYALDHETEDRAKDEALDIIVTCIRFILDERY